MGPMPAPISSLVSLSAAATAVSPASRCPPGKLTWPLWVLTLPVRIWNRTEACPWALHLCSVYGGKGGGVGELLCACHHQLFGPRSSSRGAEGHAQGDEDGRRPGPRDGGVRGQLDAGGGRRPVDQRDGVAVEPCDAPLDPGQERGVERGGWWWGRGGGVCGGSRREGAPPAEAAAAAGGMLGVLEEAAEERAGDAATAVSCCWSHTCCCSRRQQQH